MLKRFRAKCCGVLQDFKDEKAICSTCNNLLSTQTEARLVLYRYAMYMACEKKFEIYLNDEYYGELNCKENLTLCLPYGKYTLTLKCGHTIKSITTNLELTPEKPELCILTRVKMRFWKNVIYLEECKKEDIPII